MRISKKFQDFKINTEIYINPMNLQENIQRIRQMMGLLLEEETPTTTKVINVSGYDLSKVTITPIPIGQYPRTFNYSNKWVSMKTTAILDNGFVYFMLRDSLMQESIYKLDKAEFEKSLTENLPTPSPLERIEGPENPEDKESKEFKNLKNKISSQSQNLSKNTEVDLSNIPKIDLTVMQGKPFILDIWATFCGPCKNKINQVLNPLNSELSSSGLTFFYYSVDRDIEQLKEYATQNLSYATHAFDNQGFNSQIIKTYNIQGIPQTYFVDKEGNMYDLPDTLEEAKSLITQHL